jgi:ferric-dicitrate binding protein FerR (iron transport regulator)
MQDKTKQFEYLMSTHLSGGISEDEEQVLLEILNSDAKYKVLYAEMAKTRAISFIPVLENEKKSQYKNLTRTLNNVILNTSSNLIRNILKVAAIAIFVLSTSISFYYLLSDNFFREKLASSETVVPLGSQAKIILPDGTIAWLNSGSTLKYSNLYGKKNREVLLSGEGYFEVTKDKSKPFFVHTNNIQVKVLGTVFNVRSYMNDRTVEVNLLEGKVDVSMLDNNSSKKLILIPNEKMIYNKNTKTMYSCKADAAKSAQWTIGKLCFVNSSLKDISKDLERKYNVKIILESDRVKNEIFSGSLDLNQPLKFILDYLDVDKKFTKTYNGQTVSIK